MILLTKETGPADFSGVERVRIGASWDVSTGMSGGLMGKFKERRGTDLDVIGILMSGENPVRYCGLDNPDPLNNGSVLHSGDNNTGRGDGDDETITLEFSRIPRVVTAVYFTIMAFKRGASFDRAKNVSFNVYDGTGGTFDRVAEIMPSLLGNHNAHKVARAYRADGEVTESGEPSAWMFEVVNEQGTVPQGDTNSLLRFAMR